MKAVVVGAVRRRRVDGAHHPAVQVGKLVQNYSICFPYYPKSCWRKSVLRYAQLFINLSLIELC